MKVIYDKESDTLSIILSDAKVAESDETREGLILDYDRAGRLVSIELLDASEQVRAPQSVEFALAAAESEATLVREKPARRYGRR
jgi:YD repeat-containing protein